MGNKDKLTIYDGDSVYAPVLSMLPQDSKEILISTQNVIFIVYETGNQVSMGGFELSYRAGNFSLLLFKTVNHPINKVAFVNLLV